MTPLNLSRSSSDDGKSSSVTPIALQHFLDSLLEQVAVLCQSGSGCSKCAICFDLGISEFLRSGVDVLVVSRLQPPFSSAQLKTATVRPFESRMLRRIRFCLSITAPRAYGHIPIGILIDISGRYLDK